MKVHAIYIFIALLAGLLLCGSLGGSVKEGVDETLDNNEGEAVKHANDIAIAEETQEKTFLAHMMSKTRKKS